MLAVTYMLLASNTLPSATYIGLTTDASQVSWLRFSQSQLETIDSPQNTVGRMSFDSSNKIAVIIPFRNPGSLEVMKLRNAKVHLQVVEGPEDVGNSFESISWDSVNGFTALSVLNNETLVLWKLRQFANHEWRLLRIVSFDIPKDSRQRNRRVHTHQYGKDEKCWIVSLDGESEIAKGGEKQAVSYRFSLDGRSNSLIGNGFVVAAVKQGIYLAEKSYNGLGDVYNLKFINRTKMVKKVLKSMAIMWVDGENLISLPSQLYPGDVIPRGSSDFDIYNMNTMVRRKITLFHPSIRSQWYGDSVLSLNK